MSTNNPFTKHTSTMFASRGCDIDQALVYANDVISAMPVELQSHAMTAVMVVINTAANAWSQSQGPSPEQEIAAAWVRDLVAQEIDKHAQGLQSKVNEYVNEWISDNLDDKCDEWAINSLTFDDLVDKRVAEYDFEEVIQDMNLVVRLEK